MTSNNSSSTLCKDPKPSRTSYIGALTANRLNSSDHYSNKLKELVSKFELQTSKLSDAYVNHKLFPTNTEYENVYNTILNGVRQAKSDMFELQNEIESRNREYREEIEILSSNIKEDRERETRLVKDFENADDSGAAGARKVLTDRYKLQYASNFFMVIGICIALFVLYKVFTPNATLSDNVIMNNIPTINNPLNEG
jgi:hypothetical protein